MLVLDSHDPLSNQLLKKAGLPQSTIPKWHNKHVTIDGRTFASEKEGNRYSELKHLLRAGAITSFRCQVPFVVFDEFTKNGIKHQAITYVADFVVDFPNGRTDVEDTKGKPTEVFKLKQKLFEAKYPNLTIKIL